MYNEHSSFITYVNLVKEGAGSPNWREGEDGVWVKRPTFVGGDDEVVHERVYPVVDQHEERFPHLLRVIDKNKVVLLKVRLLLFIHDLEILLQSRDRCPVQLRDVLHPVFGDGHHRGDERQSMHFDHRGDERPKMHFGRYWGKRSSRRGQADECFDAKVGKRLQLLGTGIRN